MLPFRSVWPVLGVLLLTSCGSSGGTEPQPLGEGGGGGGNSNPAIVTVSNNAYSPSQLSVARGGVVTWRWDTCGGDGYGGQVCGSHSVTFDDGSPGAAVQSEGSFSRTFASVGTYAYYCSAHGRTAMSGSVAVR